MKCQTFYDSIEQQIHFLEELNDIDSGYASQKIIDYINGNKSPRRIIGIAEGRSGLSLSSALQELYNNFEGGEKHFETSVLRDDVTRHVYPNDLIFSASGSGETRSVNEFIANALEAGSEVILITGKEGSTAYKIAERYENAEVLLLNTNGSKKSEIQDNLSPMGTEFELKTAILLHSINSDVVGNGGYNKRLCDYTNGAKLLYEIDSERLYEWERRLSKRKGSIVLDGVEQSGIVAEQFEMRMAQLGRDACMLHDSNRKRFAEGDAYVPISGSGNTKEIVRVLRDSLKEGATAFPIIGNESSDVYNIMEENGIRKNIMTIPLQREIKTELTKHPSDYRINPPPEYAFRIPFFETSSYIFTNALVAELISMFNINPEYLKGNHV